MGVSYSAVKVSIPEAWEIGKDYYALTDLFPVCAYKNQLNELFVPSDRRIEELPYIIGSRHIVSSTVFKVSTFFDNATSMISRIEILKDNSLDAATKSHLEDFFAWARDDALQFISDFDELEERAAEDEYQLCKSPNQYLHMDSWGGISGRKVGEI